MNRSRLRRLKKIWAAVPDARCKGLCERSCGPIDLGPDEAALIEERIGRPIEHVGEDLVCPLLKNGRCSVYDIRPLICRLWGSVRAMQCPWGCTPEVWLPELEAKRLAREVGIGAADCASTTPKPIVDLVRSFYASLPRDEAARISDSLMLGRLQGEKRGATIEDEAREVEWALRMCEEIRDGKR